MEVTPELHGVVITCQATNGIGPQIHDAITLEVLCKFHSFPSGRIIINLEIAFILLQTSRSFCIQPTTAWT